MLQVEPKEAKVGLDKELETKWAGLAEPIEGHIDIAKYLFDKRSIKQA